jgi:hypothetical protein
MAFLGPPSSAYPPDPENYLFYRVGGGYSAKLVGGGMGGRMRARGMGKGRGNWGPAAIAV